MFLELLNTKFLHNFWLIGTHEAKVICQSNDQYNEVFRWIVCRHKEGWLYIGAVLDNTYTAESKIFEYV